MKSVSWRPTGKALKKARIDEIIAKTEYDKIKELPARYDSRTKVYMMGDKPVLKVIYKTYSETYNTFEPR